MKEKVTASTRPRAASVRRTTPAPALQPAQRRLGQRAFARQRHRRDVVIAVDAQHLFDEIGLALDIAAPGGRLDRERSPPPR